MGKIIDINFKRYSVFTLSLRSKKANNLIHKVPSIVKITEFHKLNHVFLRSECTIQISIISLEKQKL